MTDRVLTPTPEPTPQDRDDAEAILMPLPEPAGSSDFALAKEAIAIGLARARHAGEVAERERCARLVEAERDKLGGRWSLDSAYLAQAIDAIRSLAPAAEPGGGK